MKVNVKKIAQQYLKQEERDVLIYELLINHVLPKYEGKKITKREHKKISEELEAAGFENVYIAWRMSWLELSLTDSQHPSEYHRKNGQNFTFYYDSEAHQGFKIETFKARNTWASVGSYQRIAQIKASLEDGSVQKLQKAYDHLTKAQELLSAPELSSYHIPFSYALERAFGFKLEARRD